MDIVFQDKSGITLITLSGRCEGFDYLNLQQKIDAKITSGETYFAFDLSDVDYISSTSLATICAYLSECEEHNGGIVFIGAQNKVLSILECLKITTIIPNLANFNQALAYLKKSN